MMFIPEVKISVRHLIEFILRSGDINLNGYASNQQMQEGTRIHRKLQKAGGPDYQAEVRLSYTKEYDRFMLLVDGIADGVLTTPEGVFIDEIKTVTAPLEQVDESYSPLHWAQAMSYAYMYAVQSALEHIYVRLTYFQVETGKIKAMTKQYSMEALRTFFEALLDKYALWAAFEVDHREKRAISLKSLTFPFMAYRRGQRDLAASVYRTVRDKSMLFAQAPTGTGKTVSTLFPAVKAMGEGMGEKIFYLTAKTVTRQVAEQAVALMEAQGMVTKSITLTSRDRICACEIRSCDPEDCVRAKGHYDRVNEAIMDILMEETQITRETLIHYAEKYCICPFEYGLDIALWVDIIICDYNYAFDPRAYLRRFFEHGGDYILLIDEAHNLVDRAREMFSAELSKKAFLEHKKRLKTTAPKLYKAMGKMNKYFIDLRKTFDKSYDTKTMALPMELFPLLEEIIEAFQSFLGQSRHIRIEERLMDLFFALLSFSSVYKLYDERYIVYAVREEDEVRLKLFCVDPSFLLRKACKKGRAAIFFSGTLLPLRYFQEMLGGGEEDAVLRLLSPFTPDNLCLMVAQNISTRYKDRQESYQGIVQYIKAAIQAKVGNYFIFFPSFEYMRQVYSLYSETWPMDRTVLQGNRMNDQEREEFLKNFSAESETTLIGFAVMGGIFAEGIDLSGDRLLGAIIIGVGLPQLCEERDIILNYFKQRKGAGFEYAYMFPGMNRVLQAAGRVIRTEQDRGFVLLLDDRFLSQRYLNLYPQEWQGYIEVSTLEGVERILDRFWY